MNGDDDSFVRTFNTNTCRTEQRPFSLLLIEDWQSRPAVHCRRYEVPKFVFLPESACHVCRTSAFYPSLAIYSRVFNGMVPTRTGNDATPLPARTLVYCSAEDYHRQHHCRGNVTFIVENVRRRTHRPCTVRRNQTALSAERVTRDEIARDVTVARGISRTDFE